MKTPEQNEATLHRAVEQAHARRWEEDDDLPDPVQCAWCYCFMGRESGVRAVTGELCCSTSCANEHNDAVLGNES
jgi:hypothetical protein